MHEPPTITQRFPPMPLGDLTAAIRAFPKLGLAQQQAFIRRLVDIHPTLSGNWGGSWSYRRVRKLRFGQVPRSVDELIWRKGVPAALGRANPAGFQVLYLADRMDTAFREARVENDPAAVTIFQVRPGRSFRVATVGEHTMISRCGRGFLLGQDPALADKFKDFHNACNREQALALLITDAFLLDCFTNRQANYEISSTVARTMFDKIGEVTAVAYPSVRQPGAVNFAVRVENVWDAWGVHGVRLGHARHLAQGYYQFDDHQHVRGITAEGHLHWCETRGNVRGFVPPWVPGEGIKMND